MDECMAEEHCLLDQRRRGATLETNCQVANLFMESTLATGTWHYNSIVFNNSRNASNSSFDNVTPFPIF